MAVSVRAARPADVDAIAAFTAGTWPEREESDYLPDVIAGWIEREDDRQTAVAVEDDEPIGVAQAVLLSPDEAWGQGMRVHPDHRGRGVATALADHLFDWGRAQGATVVRAMAHGWNEGGMGQARAAGYEPRTQVRRVHPDPTGDRTEAADRIVVTDPAVAWRAWTDAGDAMDGLGVSPAESWAYTEVDRETVETAATDRWVGAVRSPAGASGCAYRVRTTERDGETVAVYGAGVWDDGASARALFGAIRADAADVGADATRVIVPDTARHVTDTARCRVAVADSADVLLAADLTGAQSGRGG
ncbi:GNAT family N-acetyltransferase [Halobacteriales archaeon SW_7_68_16]|nr:MAG: GNAT family N-acetyltransferase [Halobacteriales archaeon SW_7_68_16]